MLPLLSAICRKRTYLDKNGWQHTIRISNAAPWITESSLHDVWIFTYPTNTPHYPGTHTADTSSSTPHNIYTSWHHSWHHTKTWLQPMGTEINEVLFPWQWKNVTFYIAEDVLVMSYMHEIPVLLSLTMSMEDTLSLCSPSPPSPLSDTCHVHKGMPDDCTMTTQSMKMAQKWREVAGTVEHKVATRALLDNWKRMVKLFSTICMVYCQHCSL